MFLKYFKNSKGITLIEILAAILLFMILASLTTVLISNVFSSNSTASASVSLRQDTNVLVNDLRKQYGDSGNDPLCFNHTGDGLEVDYPNTKIIQDGTNKTITNGCIDDVDKSKPLEIELVTKREDSKPMTTKTTLIKADEFNAKTPPKDTIPDKDPPKANATISVGELPCDSKVALKKYNQDREKDFDNLSTQQWSAKYNEPKPTKLIPIESPIHIIWTGTKVDTSCGKNHDILGESGLDSLTIVNKPAEEGTGGLKDVTINVGNKLIAKEHLDLRGAATINVGGDAVFEAQVDLNTKGGAQIVIQGSALAEEQIEVYKDSGIQVANTFFTKASLDLKNNSDFIVDGNIHFMGSSALTVTGNGKLILTKHAVFEEAVEFLGKSQIEIGGNAHFKDSFDLTSNLNIYGSAFFHKSSSSKSGSTLKVHKNATFHKPDAAEIKGSLCVQGNLVPNGKSGRIPAKDKMSNCEYPEPSLK